MKYVVTRPYEGTWSDIESAAKRYGEKFRAEFGGDTVDVAYGTFQYKSERIIGGKPGVVFKVSMKFTVAVGTEED